MLKVWVIFSANAIPQITEHLTQIKGNVSVLPGGSAQLCLAFCGEKNNMFPVIDVYNRKKDRQIEKLLQTSSVFSPDHGCDFAGPPCEAWCPAAPLSVSGTSFSAAAQSAAHPHYLSANQPAAARTHTQTHVNKQTTFLFFLLWWIKVKCILHEHK